MGGEYVQELLILVKHAEFAVNYFTFNIYFPLYFKKKIFVIL
jgi:hypothetical protein